ncbi:sugar transferase [Puia sp.]|jgi:lipopolysaccharide/colanic/teichoic acid biosynthesis glycosyltransferase|uniref:sugar transferase n=1 Tax=Puia sp. TaxID=2045100 RepID=UPI002F424B3D
MDLIYLPQTVQKAKKIAPRATFRSYHLPQTGNFQFSGFCYIGRNSNNIMKLVELYKEGAVLEGLEKAKTELLKSVEQGKNKLPEVIVCEARFDFAVISHFNQFLRKHTVLSGIPFILDVSGLGDKDVLLYRKHARPDEMLFIEECEKEDLISKIRFLCKMKAHTGKDTAEPKIEEKSLRSLRFGPMTKRAFDILVASVTLLLLSPLFLLIALAVRLESRGPIFYIAKRAGRGYKIFNFYKFRTMIHGADKKIADLAHLNQYGGEAKGPVFFKINNDPRITKVGSFLRNTSLDELPQLVNVLIGDMSLVGNRPLPLYEAKNLTTDDYAARFMAPAGITGLWQVKKRGTKDMSVEERISLDIDYATKCNFVTDFWIIANTPSALLQRENV